MANEYAVYTSFSPGQYFTTISRISPQICSTYDDKYSSYGSYTACRFPICFHRDLHTLTPTLNPFTHRAGLTRSRTRLCAVLRLRCLAQGWCGVAVAGAAPPGIQRPRHVFRPPAGKHTFKATDSARGRHGAHGIHNSLWSSEKVWGTDGKISSVSTWRLFTAVHSVKANPEDLSGVKRVSVRFCSRFFFGTCCREDNWLDLIVS